MTGPAPEIALAGATKHFDLGGLERWSDIGSYCGDFWTAPAGTTASLEIVGGATGDDLAPELQWSTRAADVPATRGLAFFDGPGFGSISVDFEWAHDFAEEVAEFVSARTGDEVGPIEVLCFRPATWPRPTLTSAGVEFDFPHVGGARVHLVLTLPSDAATPTESEAPR